MKKELGGPLLQRLYNEHVPDAKKDIAVDNAKFKLVKEYNGRA